MYKKTKQIKMRKLFIILNRLVLFLRKIMKQIINLMLQSLNKIIIKQSINLMFWISYHHLLQMDVICDLQIIQELFGIKIL